MRFIVTTFHSATELICNNAYDTHDTAKHIIIIMLIHIPYQGYTEDSYVIQFISGIHQ